MLIVAVNVAFAVVFALINARYIISFEVAFIGAGLVFYSSYRAIMQKINIFANGAESNLYFANCTQNAESSPRFCDSNAKNAESNLDSASEPNIAESSPICHSERSEESQKNTQNRDSSLAPLPQNDNLRKNAESNQNTALDSANEPHIAESALDNLPKSTPENLPKKERFFLGAKISFGLLRILSYALLGISIIALINNGVFFLTPFLSGIALSTLTSALYVARKGQRVVL